MGWNLSTIRYAPIPTPNLPQVPRQWRAQPSLYRLSWCALQLSAFSTGWFCTSLSSIPWPRFQKRSGFLLPFAQSSPFQKDPATSPFTHIRLVFPCFDFFFKVMRLNKLFQPEYHWGVNNHLVWLKMKSGMLAIPHPPQVPRLGPLEMRLSSPPISTSTLG